MAWPRMPCARCGASMPRRPDKRSDLCQRCWRDARCSACGQQLGIGEHTCVSVDLRATRQCTDCGAELSNSGYERWKSRCGRCDKKRWRQKRIALRVRLIAQFGGSCQRCGYEQCRAALHFHHVDSSEKGEWGSKKGSAEITEVAKHPERFELVCANCHFEIHNPTLMLIAETEVAS